MSKRGEGMATIRTAINMTDNLSPIFRSINSALQLTISGFENLQDASGNVVDISRLQQAQRELARVDEMFNRIEGEIRDAENAQGHLNNRIRDGTNAMDGLVGKVMGLIGAYLSLQGLGKVIQLSDQMTDLKARVQLLVEDMPVIPDQIAKVDFGLGNMSDIDLAQQMIHDAAQRAYSPVKDTANMVARIGTNARDAFSNMGEVVAFTELVQKSFGIAGANATEASNATLQLSQALASGVLRGDELNSIFEQAPNLIATIADYMGEPIGAIRELASDGAITAEIVKNAMFAATDEINNKFNSMPVTWSQMWTFFTNEALRAFEPVLQKINDIANSERFKSFITSATQTLYFVAGVIEQIMSAIMIVGAFIYDNWSYAEVAIVAATIALVAYAIAMAWVNREIVINAFMTAIAAIRNVWYVATTVLATFATYGFTAAMAALSVAIAANPIAWLIGAIVVLVVLFYLAVAVINHFTGSSISATGIIAGAFMVLGTVIYNVIAYMWNMWASYIEFFVNAKKDGTYAVKRLLGNLANNALDMATSMIGSFDSAATNLANVFVDGANIAIGAINWIIDALNEIPGVNLGKFGKVTARTSIVADYSNLKGVINDWVGEAPADYWEAPKMELKSLSDAWNTGYNWGDNLFNPQESAGGVNTDALMKSINDALAMGDGIGDKLDTGNDDGKKTAGNTKKAADGIKMLNEDLKYLRDIAEREAINRYTTAEINIDARSENHINNEMDIDGIIDRFAEKAEEAATMLAEGGPTEHV